MQPHFLVTEGQNEQGVPIFGIAMERDGIRLDAVRDFTTQAAFAAQTAALLEREQVSPAHFRDVLEDLLCCT